MHCPFIPQFVYWLHGLEGCGCGTGTGFGWLLLGSQQHLFDRQELNPPPH